MVTIEILINPHFPFQVMYIAELFLGIKNWKGP